MHRCTWYNLFLLEEQAAEEMLPRVCQFRNLERKRQEYFLLACCGLICFGLLLPNFSLNVKLGVFCVSICKLPGKDCLLPVKVWLLCAISGVPVLPMCTCDLEHRNSIANSRSTSEGCVLHSKVQTLFQNRVLSSSLALLRLLVRMGSLSVFANVPALVPMLLLLALLFSLSPTPSFFFFFLSSLSLVSPWCTDSEFNADVV